MKCKECKGSGKYQPLIGPVEPCRVCQVDTPTDVRDVAGIPPKDIFDASIKQDVLYPISQLSVTETISPRTVDEVMRVIVSQESVKVKIVVNKRGRVTQGAAAVLALKKMKYCHTKQYDKLVKNGELLVFMNLRDYDHVMEATLTEQAMGNAHIKSLHRTMGILTTAMSRASKVLATEIPSGWTNEQRGTWVEISGGINTMLNTLKRMQDRTDSL